MAKKRDGEKLARAAARGKRAQKKTMSLVALKDLRKAAGLTQKDLAEALEVGQDTISRLENRNDMLVSTLRHYIESVGGQLLLVATFPNRPPVAIDHLGE